jgi:hypothetical protein
VIVPVVIVVALAIAIPTAMAVGGSTVHVTGVKDGALLGKASASHLSIRFSSPGSDLSGATVKLDGHRLRASDPAHHALVVRPRHLSDGRHTVTVDVPGGLFGGGSASRSFTVDTTPPKLSLQLPGKHVKLADPVTVTGHVSGGAKVTAAGAKVTDSSGKLTIRYPKPPASAKVVATDKAGNRTAKTIDVPVRYPVKVRAIHETGNSWAFARDRNEALKLIKQHKINAIQLDIKDEDGAVNFDPHVPLASKIDAVHHYYDPAKTVAKLHKKGVRVIGRVLAFGDPKLADWAWKHGHHDWVVQTPSGQMWGKSYGLPPWTNPANKAVRDYNIAIAKAAVKAGFDDIVFDGIRRPPDSLSNIKLAGIPHTHQAAQQAVTGFAAQARKVLRPMGAFVGAAIFAQAATAPQDTAQNVPQLAKYLDVVMPMDYPSHWTHGEYHVPDPNAGPKATHDIVYRSLKDWKKAVKGTDCQIVPWLQAEDFRGTYTPAMVASQIKAARQDGMPGFLWWNASAYYPKYESVLTPDAPNVLR